MFNLLLWGLFIVIIPPIVMLIVAARSSQKEENRMDVVYDYLMQQIESLYASGKNDVDIAEYLWQVYSSSEDYHQVCWMLNPFLEDAFDYGERRLFIPNFFYHEERASQFKARIKRLYPNAYTSHDTSSYIVNGDAYSKLCNEQAHRLSSEVIGKVNRYRNISLDKQEVVHCPHCGYYQGITRYTTKCPLCNYPIAEFFASHKDI